MTRIVKRLFAQVSRLFFRNIFLVSCYALVFLVLNGVACYRFIQVFPDAPLFFLQSSLEFCLLVFLFFLVFSFEFYGVLGRSSLGELHRASWQGTLRFRACQSLILLGALLVLVLSQLGWETAMYFRCQLDAPRFYLHVLKAYLLNFVLPGLVACMVGCLLAERCKRLVAYVVIFLLVLLGLPPVTEQLTMLTTVLPEWLGVPVCRFLDLFSLNPRGLNTVPDWGYGIPMEPYRWQIALFALFLLAALLLLLQWQRLRAALRGVGVVLLAASVACMGASFVRGSTVVHDYRSDGVVMFDQGYYTLEHAGRVKAADFRVAEYQLQLRLRNRLEAEVVMALEAPAPRPVYSFTLHHSLKIQEVRDARTGTALPYERGGDYLDVYPSDPAQIPQIRLVYQGASPIYYSNAQGVCLAGTYAYYPMEGYHKIYDGDYRAKAAAGQRRFDVTVESNLSIMCNLPAVGENHFAGESEGLTLTGGFYQLYEHDGMRIYDTFLNPNIARNPESLAGLDGQLAAYSRLLGTQFACDLQGKLLVNLGAHTASRSAVFSDHILLPGGVDAQELAIAVVCQTIPDNAVKAPLQNLFRYGLMDGMDDVRDIYAEAFQDSLAQRIVSQSDALGEEAVFRAMYRYLIDESDQRTPEQMLDSLS